MLTLKEQYEFYKIRFGLDIKTVDEMCPSKDDGEFSWFALIPPNLHLEEIISACKKCFYVALMVKQEDWALIQDGTGTQPKNEWFQNLQFLFMRPSLRGDRTYANNSFADIREKGVGGVTICEEILIQFMYWHKHQHFLLNPSDGGTICTASFTVHSGVPMVWVGRKKSDSTLALCLDLVTAWQKDELLFPREVRRRPLWLVGNRRIVK
ncbi:hypothetical protein A2926_00630 [Candidatus Giovannonibacteria bacterium RIFCSPLOWO2_01_FULL_44_40]|uniref:Uncharacterized protein n=1 Tax=Candidatus Giovannonibacteria bacterium RIFCSPHIGHO2_01_FULL_45_23 TaxID=1798325 RepID=A0A1F5VI51_9BACT|nr:MAG: hypothetical protein A2834_04335 [Candidatus Giovannonibacteria bacterium RIFCSPHIGHO2_01_FULL_45_23]OGF75857.1 MAG: hypothetical protein A3C77_02815 [Candidatus Giovannonibacteria bacterium RIFCSPHIGHO2_02_FULL_45_13]OGF80164.1 MAG: hypothetical protein A2926_00630 [Candidatus Giovannonibacteria bacterium RIFCSPLOWO2_01_FULL_44_40]